MSDRFFFSGPIPLNEITLVGDEAHHLSNVRRIREGDSITLFNGEGGHYLARVIAVAKRTVTVQVVEHRPTPVERGLRCVIASALPKGDRLDFLIEKLTELSVATWIPLITERSVVVPREEKREKWQRAVIEACKQCGRDSLMEIASPLSFSQLLNAPNFPPTRYLAHPGGPRLRFEETLKEVVIAIGPEGGFSESESQLAQSHGWNLLSLGETILRIETAAVAVASACRFVSYPASGSK